MILMPKSKGEICGVLARRVLQLKCVGKFIESLVKNPYVYWTVNAADCWDSSV